MSDHACRICAAPLHTIMVDLGLSPLANAYPSMEDTDSPETFYPLRVFVCDRCFLVQANVVAAPDKIFSNYAYFSSYSETWLQQSAQFAGEAIRRFGLGKESRVVEVASNDGYLLQYFGGEGVPVFGIEPARNVAAVAQHKGIATEVAFFGRETAERVLRERGSADLLIANNVIAHVPDLHDFVAGMAMLMGGSGVATVEFQHVLNVIENNQFDTIYHEHFSYHSLLTIEKLFAEHGLHIFDVRELPTHGGSLRLYLDKGTQTVHGSVAAMRDRERTAGLQEIGTYEAYGTRVRACKSAILQFFLEQQTRGKTIAGYGAPAKGNTFLNYCGISPDFLPYTVDRNPHKVGHYLPGLRIPILPPEHIMESKPDFVLILPWNLRDEIIEQMQHIREWGARFVVAIPQLEIIP